MSFVTIWVLEFVIIWVLNSTQFEFCHILSFLSFFSHNLSLGLGTGEGNIARIAIAAQRTSLWLSRCQNVLTKKTLLMCFLPLFFINLHLSYLKFCHSLSFWVLSQFEFLSIFHNLSFWVLSKLEFCDILSIYSSL